MRGGGLSEENLTEVTHESEGGVSETVRSWCIEQLEAASGVLLLMH